MTIARLRVRLGVATVRTQCKSMLGGLEVLGPGAATARGRRRQATTLERFWGKEQQAAHVATRRQGWKAYRTGYC